MVGFSEDPAWGKACTPGKGHNTGSYSERLAWDFACYPGPLPSSCKRLTSDIDLSTLTLPTGIKIIGAAVNDYSGWSVSSAGDVNNDGYADFIIGAYGASSNAGKSYLIFGSKSLLSIDLGNLGSAGITITGAAGDYSGWSVSSAGDVNNDDYDDFIIGAWGVNINAGESYLIYGADSLPATIDLSSLGAYGITITGAVAGDNSGYSVSGAGDVNGDGISDILIGAPEADPGGNSNAGKSYLIYGSASLPTTIDLNSPLGAYGITISGAITNGYSGRSVSGAGDVNGDGISDILIGAPIANSRDGVTYIIYGDNTLADFTLPPDPGEGITITGETGSGLDNGRSVSGAGDVNGDGISDILIGASGSSAPDTGKSYLIYGSTSLPDTIDLGALGSNGITMTGGIGDFAGFSVSDAGDQDGDGYADFLIGAANADPEGRANAGEGYLIYGSDSLEDFTLPPDPGTGITIKGAVANDFSGSSISGAGDVTGDGCPDLLIGAPYADPDEHSNAGESYLIL